MVFLMCLSLIIIIFQRNINQKQWSYAKTKLMCWIMWTCTRRKLYKLIHIEMHMERVLIFGLRFLGKYSHHVLSVSWSGVLPCLYRRVQGLQWSIPIVSTSHHMREVFHIRQVCSIQSFFLSFLSRSSLSDKEVKKQVNYSIKFTI